MASANPDRLTPKEIERIARDESLGRATDLAHEEREAKAKEDYQQAMRENAPYLMLGMQMAMTIALAAAIGWWIDRRAGTSMWLGICSGIGAVVGMGYFILVVLRLDKRQSAAPKTGQHQ